MPLFEINPITGELEERRSDMHFDGDDRDWEDFGGWCRNQNCTLSADHLKNPNTQSCKAGDQVIVDSTPPSSSVTPYQYTMPAALPEKCRHEPTACFRIKNGDVTYYGGSDSKVREFEFDGLVICLLNRDNLITPKKPVRSTGDWAKKLTTYMDMDVAHPNYMTIDWPDYGVPPVLPGFFKELHKLAVEKGIKKVLFYCMGGHGRTGTALAATLIENCDLSSEQATEWVHEQYCHEAIESAGQKDFLRDLAGEESITTR